MSILRSECERLFETLNTLFNEFRDEEQKRIQEIISHEMGKYQSGISIRDSWCCQNMREFALKQFGINNPNFSDNGGGFKTSLMMYGFCVNYCPFCGAKL